MGESALWSLCECWCCCRVPLQGAGQMSVAVCALELGCWLQGPAPCRVLLHVAARCIWPCAIWSLCPDAAARHRPNVQMFVPCGFGCHARCCCCRALLPVYGSLHYGACVLVPLWALPDVCGSVRFGAWVLGSLQGVAARCAIWSVGATAMLPTKTVAI